MVENTVPFHHIPLPPEPVPLNIKNPTAEHLARTLAQATGSTITDAVIDALRIQLAAVQRRQERPGLRSEITALQDFLRSQPERDSRSAEEILGYDEFGLPR